MTPNAAQVSFTAPPISQSLIGSDAPKTATEQAQRSASRPWAIWFNAVAKRFQTTQVSIRTVTGDTLLNLADGTVIGIISGSGSATWTLLDAATVQGQIFILKNAAASTTTITLKASLNQMVDYAAASGIVLFPGNCVQLQSDGGNWSIVGQVK